MIKNLKILGLALVAVFAMSAMAASAASAQGVVTLSEGESASLHALSSEHKFTSAAGTIECTESTFSANVNHLDEEVTIVPEYGGTCTAAGLPATVDENGCDFDLYDATTGEGDYNATVDITCPGGAPGIVVTAFAGTGHSFRVCTITVPPQTGVGPVTVTNKAAVETEDETIHPDDIILEGTAKGISYTKSGLCGSESGEAEYDLGTTTVVANGGSTGITISD